MKIRIDRLIWHGCEYGKRQLTKLQRRFSDGCKNPYRCAEHTDQVRESELMSGTVEPWWRDGTTEEDRAIITGLNPENFSSKNDCKAFHDTCNMWWRSKTNDEKIRIWRQATRSEE